MRPHIINGSTCLLLGLTAFAAGCQSGTRFEFHNPEPVAAQARTRFPSIEPDQATQQQPTVRATAPATRSTDPARQARLVGMYGDVGHRHTAPTGLPDGTRNLAQVTRFTEGACFDPEIDRTGTTLAFASTVHGVTADIYTKSVGGSTVRKITADPANDVMPSISPDQQDIAFASDRAGNWDIYIESIEGSRPRQVTSDPEHEIHPTWSPDGTRLAYCKFGAQSQRWEIWMINLSTPGVQTFLTYGMYPQWSPDVSRSKILFQRARERGSRLFGVWTVDLVNDEATGLTEIISAGNAAVMHPSWSPDGSRIVFVTVVNPDPTDGATPEQADVWTINVNGTGRTSLTDGGDANFQPTWAPGGLVYFVSDRSGTENIWSVGAGQSTTPASGTGVVTVDPASTPDRRP